MKKFVLGSLAILAMSAIAQAADVLPVKAPIAAPAWSWTGLYLGINGGYSWGRSRTDTAFATTGGVPIVPPAGSVTSTSANLNGGIFGGQIGYNWQNGSWLAGLETDIQWSGEKGSSTLLCASTATGGVCLPTLTFLPAGATGSVLTLDQKLKWFGTLRGRLGLLPAPTWVVYITGGLAYGQISTDATLASFTAAGLATSAVTSSSTTKTGWTIGGGVEGRISGNWTGRIEYLYMDFGSVSGNVVNTAGGIQANWSSRITDNVLRGALNYKF